MPDASPPVRRLQEALGRLAGQTRVRPLTGRTHADADDITGTVLTDDAAGFDPLPLLCALDQAGARVVVIGQVAGIMHGSRELTGDLDLLWDGDAAQAGAMATAFAASSARLTDDDGLVRSEPEAFARPKVLFRTATASGDCCTPALPWGSLPVMDFIGYIETVSWRRLRSCGSQPTHPSPQPHRSPSPSFDDL
jgi:hypothetical protein